MATLLDELDQLTTAFEANDLAYAICGGIGLAIHGFVRATLNVDVLIERRSFGKVSKIAAQNGYNIRTVEKLKKGGIEFHRTSKLDSNTETLPLQLILVESQLLKIWDTRESLKYQGKRLTIVSRTGLIEMKRLARRPQDLVDIERLETEVSTGKLFQAVFRKSTSFVNYRLLYSKLKRWRHTKH